MHQPWAISKAPVHLQFPLFWARHSSEAGYLDMTLLSSLETSANELELRKMLDALVVKPPSQKELCLRFHEACITEAAALLPPTSSTGSPEKPEKAETLQDEVDAVIEDVLEVSPSSVSKQVKQTVNITRYCESKNMSNYRPHPRIKERLFRS